MEEEGIIDKKSIPTTSLEEADEEADIAFETMSEDKDAKKRISPD